MPYTYKSFPWVLKSILNGEGSTYYIDDINTLRAIGCFSGVLDSGQRKIFCDLFEALSYVKFIMDEEFLKKVKEMLNIDEEIMLIIEETLNETLMLKKSQNKSM